MILYHGSTAAIPHPDVSLSRSNLDFGRGFYLTSYCEQAIDWAKRKAFLGDCHGIVSQYAVDMYYQGIWDMRQTLEALRFYRVNDQWCFVSQKAIDNQLCYTCHWEV